MTILRAHHFSCLYIFCLLIIAGCKKQSEPRSDSPPRQGTYAYDAEFLKAHHRKVIELRDDHDQARVLITAEDQGRVMTSTVEGDSGRSFGWINYDLISSGKRKKQFNPVGGEERFWLGPEGGQFSLYFPPKDSFNINHWQVPGVIDTVPYELGLISKKMVVFNKQASLTNYSGTVFDLSIERSIRMLEKTELSTALHTNFPDQLKFVAYETINRIKNTGTNGWAKNKGLLSIWLLGMMIPGQSTHVIIPFHPHANAKNLINTNYFGDIPADRLVIQDSVLLFKCDGKYRSKIGLSPSIAKPMAASFDFRKNILTFILFSVQKNKPYVNSKWEIQKEPFKGDVVNAYNDGPLADGSQLGPFYELESSSPALELKAGDTGEYGQITCHITGDFESLNTIARTVLGIDLSEIADE